MKTAFVLNVHIVNAYTGEIYPYKVGSKHEQLFHRVMPMDSSTKLFFKDEKEYIKWRIREYTEYNPEPHIENDERPEEMPEKFPIMEIPPLAMRIVKK